MQPQQAALTLGQKLEIITAHKNGTSFPDLSSDHSVNESIIECVLIRSPRLKKGTIKEYRVRHLQLGDKMRVLHLLDNGVGPTELCAEFGIFHSTIYRLKANRKKLIAMDKNRVNFTV